MFLQKIHRFFSFKRLFVFLLIFVIGIQLIVISYNHYSGYYSLDGLEHFLIRMFRGTLLSLIAGFLIAYPDLFVIYHLNKKFPWGRKIIPRITIELIAALSIAVIISIVVTMFAHSMKPYKHELSNVLFNNALIYAVVNLFIISFFEGWISYVESKQAKQMADTLKDELSQIKFEVLKSQINPHFMFNSLNVLSGLINKDVSKAQQFIDEFSMIYRYVLETIEQPVTTLEKELEFMRSYLFLQQIRYGENLTYSVNVSAELLNWFLPPLSLQVVLENAMKHNIINEAKPLHIDIKDDNFSLIVRNNIQPKISKGISTGLGLKNLSKRYALIGKLEPEFKVETNHYVAKLPLLKPENDEHSNN
ncbi:sensor histidine kinase [Draconibacterium halophilum]|uniref:Signal transduction histidine kinase internal region domain-containing protein n=1 Tax=Draconibacterium halophilum TaxID=2706887 RepID=A0A6C0RC24_9BACT|nr:histidine kinase [Draconibacterium halophilum]QIA07452.1 hypothetical protein G0Q07_06815 [Draconibacterium halophilum]